MGVLASLASKVGSALKGAVPSGSAGNTNFNKPMTGTLQPTVGFSAPIQKGPSIHSALSSIGASSSSGANGHPNS